MAERTQFPDARELRKSLKVMEFQGFGLSISAHDSARTNPKLGSRAGGGASCIERGRALGWRRNIGAARGGRGLGAEAFWATAGRG